MFFEVVCIYTKPLALKKNIFPSVIKQDCFELPKVKIPLPFVIHNS